MPAIRKDLPPGERRWSPVSSTPAKPNPDFEVANDSGKVRCTICLANSGCEPWIHRSSAAAHTKTERHNRGVAAKRQRADETARDNEQWKGVTSETENLFGKGFIPADAIPNIRVTGKEPTTVSSQLRADEEEEMMRRVLRHLNAPQKDDPTSCPIHSWQLADQSLEAQVAQVVAGNLTALDSNTGGDDDVLTNVINTARSWIPPPFHGHVYLISHNSRLAAVHRRGRTSRIWEVAPR